MRLYHIFLLIKLINGFAEITDDPQDNSIPCIIRLCTHYFRSKHVMKGSLVMINLTPNPSLFQTKIIESINADRSHEFSIMVKDSRKKHENPVHVLLLINYILHLKH